MLEPAIANAIESYKPYMSQTRGYLHEHPELSSQEHETSAFCQAEMAKLGCTIHTIEGTGFIAEMATGKPGRTIALRTDIDGLPVQENPHNLAGPKRYVSKNDGAMHACGHDGHMTTLLTTAKVLHDIKDQLTGTILFLFEEAEENGGGILFMIEGMKRFTIDAVYGNHYLSYLPQGSFCVSEGPRMSGAAVVDFTVHGKGGHGSRPDLAINPVFPLAQILTNLSTAWVNQLDITKTVTLGMAKISCGTVGNVFADSAHCAGTLRFFDVDAGNKAKQVLFKVADNVAAAHNCTVTYTDKTVEFLGKPVINRPKLSAFARQTATKLFGEDCLVEDYIWYASESFSEYGYIWPSHFTFVGVGNEVYGAGADQHNEHFDFDDAVIAGAAQLMTQFAVDFLASDVSDTPVPLPPGIDPIHVAPEHAGASS